MFPFLQKNNSTLKHLDFAILDLLALALSFFISYLIKLKDGIAQFNKLYFIVFVWMMICGIGFPILFNPYKNVLRRGRLAEIRCSLLFIFFNAIAVTLGLYVFKQGSSYSRTQLAYTYFLFFLLSLIFRFFRKEQLIKSKRDNKINILIITDDSNIDPISYNIENSEFAEYQIKGIFLCDDEEYKNDKYSFYRLSDDLYRVAIDNNVLEVFAYCKPELIDKEIIKKLMEDGIEFHLSIDKIFDFEPDNEELSNLAMYRTLNINSFSFSAKQIAYAPLKRFFDIFFSLVACLFLLPIFIVVKLSYIFEGDKEPVLYAHTRIGKNGKEFKLYKFRSMVYNADEVLKELLKDENNRKEWEENHKLENDPRITKIGKFIRKTSLDEFPQFINVLKGDMSIIGPRPLVPGELKEKNGLNLYERIKPGSTGWWGCNGRSNISYEERLELEYYYVKNHSLGLDIMCILKTIYVVLFQKGAK